MQIKHVGQFKIYIALIKFRQIRKSVVFVLSINTTYLCDDYFKYKRFCCKQMVAKLCFINFFIFVMLFVSTARKVAMNVRVQCSFVIDRNLSKNLHTQVNGNNFTLLSIFYLFSSMFSIF